MCLKYYVLQPKTGCDSIKCVLLLWVTKIFFARYFSKQIFNEIPT